MSASQIRIIIAHTRVKRSGPRASRQSQSQCCRPFDDASFLRITTVNHQELLSYCRAMFILTQLEEDVRIQPSDLSLPPLEAVTDVIERRFLDKVCCGPKDAGFPMHPPMHLPMHRTCPYRSWSVCNSCATLMHSHAPMGPARSAPSHLPSDDAPSQFIPCAGSTLPTFHTSAPPF